jgi:hypothetical protein
MIQQPASTSLLSEPLSSHLHIDNEKCPWCEQVIPSEKLEEVSGKIAAREHEQVLAITARLQQQYTLDKAQADAKAKADLELERRRNAERLAEAERSRQEMQAGFQLMIAQAEGARVNAEQANAALQMQVQQARTDAEAAVEKTKTEAKAREAEVRSEAQLAARAAVAEEIASIENKSASLQLKLQQLTTAKDAEIAKVKEEAAAEIVRVSKEATEAAALLVRDNLDASEKAVTEAKKKALEAEEKLVTLKAEHSESLNSLREVMEKANADALNSEKAKAFQENQKLSTRVNELQRALEKKTNEELGEGAEVDVFEALKTNFPDDRITRIQKGTPGGDILHVVRLHGKECGTIIYDSKNHKQFRNEHVAKLKADQLAAKAEHAILSTHKFPQGTSQLHLQDGVLLANPARVVLLATLLRQHLILVYTLRLSGIERESKVAALYEYITSERCSQLLSRVDARTDELLDQQDKEVKWHQNNWKKQGEAIRAIQKAKAELGNEIGLIIGIADGGAPETETTEL